jgi:hypothetical protein
MKRFAIWIILCSFLTMTTIGGCAYDKAYQSYATAQSNMAVASSALVKLGPDGKVTEIGNPMVGLAMIQMQAPKDGWTQFFDFLKFATPFAAIYGVVGAMTAGVHGNNTNVSGQGNYTGNTMGSTGLMGSPTTTTTTTVTEGIPVE